MRPRYSPPRRLVLNVTFLPEDFPERLTTLKEASGLSWEGLAACMGMDARQVMRWRQDTKPGGDAMFALFLLAARVPGGVHMLLGTRVSPPPGGFQPPLTANEVALGEPEAPASSGGSCRDGERCSDIQPAELIRSALHLSNALGELFPDAAEALRSEGGEG